MDFIELDVELDSLERARDKAERDAAMRFSVLHADDCVSHRFLLRANFELSPCLKPLADVEDGTEVIEYLSGSGKYSDRAVYPFPNLLLLDIDLPCRTGLQVLGWIRTQKLPALRVVMVSNCLTPENARTAFELGADYYQAKPVTTFQLRPFVRRLELLMVLLYHRALK